MPGTDAERLRRFVHEFWNAGDLDRYMEIYTDDACLRPDVGAGGGVTIHGRDAIRRFFAEIHRPVDLGEAEEHGDQVMMPFTWRGGHHAPDSPSGGWTLLYTFAGGQVVRAEYFRDRALAERSVGVGLHAVPGLGAATICEAFQLTAARQPRSVALRTAGSDATIDWATFADRVRRVAGGLHRLGVRRGEPVALMLANRPEFHIVDLGAAHLGAVPFSVYSTSSAAQIRYVLQSSGARVLVTEAAMLETALAVSAEVAGVEQVILVDPVDPDSRVLSLADLERPVPGDADFDFDAEWRGVRPDDLVTMIYTSGTTGPPKCVQITHRNMLTEWAGLHQVFNIRPGGRTLSWLPAAHIADRLLGHYQQVIFGHCVTCLPDPSRLAAVLAQVHPTFWVAVPRIWEKLKAALESSLDDEARAAVEIGLRRVRAQQRGEAVDPGVAAACAEADERVFAGLRRQLGLDAAEQHIVGAAPIPVAVLEFFHAIGIPVCEVWGMSELAIATANPPGATRLGTVGPPVPGVELTLAEDGEVLVRGPLRMPGYRNDPEKTAEAIDSAGWLHTGDVGELQESGYLRIVDRKKELIINATGKNMSPSFIEAELKSASPLIGQAVAVGDGRSYNVALIVLDPDAAGAYARTHGIPDARPQVLAGDAGVQAAIAEAVARANGNLARAEQIRRFTVLAEEWGPGGEELTPTSKLRRKQIAEKYASVIDGLYASTHA